ncbi:tyrosine-type recombinase/integrase [Altererythrobacter aerius]|uniref:Tyrosine-type recombinase/integrase n=1 Tax=Tsuneonella aeria TaxID=1837929 RepID=A0A6I4TDI9_9SPHN|nr:site-specific integrase [Tsuneonella aeria]MXO75123.1 tyrosine-type recombinase/integrase [Tsuneonella aeria]
MKTKLTVKSIEALQPADKDQIIWDAELPGFGCKVTPKGRKSYFLYYRTKDGQQRRPAIGTHGPLRPEAAREIAKRWLAEVAAGGDPSQTRKIDRSAPTVNKLCDRYLEEHAETRKKASSVKNDRRIIDVHIRPAIGAKKIASVARSDISALHHSLRSTPYEANRMLALASKMFSLAERWSLRPDNTNPAKNIDRFREEKRERYLSPAELKRLWIALNSPEAKEKASDSAIAAIKLLILTGRRVSEVLGLRWEWIDFKAKTMRLPDTKGGTLFVSLADSTIAVLEELHQSRQARLERQKNAKPDEDSELNPFVIEGKRQGQPLVNLQKPWRAMREMAKIDDVRLHDLRHTYASVGAGLGMSLPLLGRLLGHSQPATTSRYAHLAQSPVSVAANQIGDELIRLATNDQHP